MSNKKYQIVFTIVNNSLLAPSLHLLELESPQGNLPEIHPGQFVNILAPKSSGKLLRRPISVCDVRDGRLILMVKAVGGGTDAICSLNEGDKLDIILPLGNGFTVPEGNGHHYLLAGGGVGIAPLLYFGRVLAAGGNRPVFLLGGRSQADIPLLDEFRRLGDVYVTTEDGSMGVRGFVTNHPVMNENFDRISVCGPTPMMKAVGQRASGNGIPCEVSLENMMACGIGACLCCVQETKDEGNQCVCTKGPVFNFEKIKW